jgi:hypothetical protein
VRKEVNNDCTRIYRIVSGLYRDCFSDETLEFSMRTKQIIDGFKNIQKFRAVINGVIIGDNQVKDLVGNRFQQTDQRIAVWQALEKIASSHRIGCTLVDSYGTTYEFYDGKMKKSVIDVQVDLI